MWFFMLLVSWLTPGVLLGLGSSFAKRVRAEEAARDDEKPPTPQAEKALAMRKILGKGWTRLGIFWMVTATILMLFFIRASLFHAGLACIVLVIIETLSLLTPYISIRKYLEK